MAELYSRRSFLAGALTAGMLSTSAGYFFTRRNKIQLTLATGADPTGGRQLLVSMWNRLNPNVQIQVREVNSSTQDQFLKFNETHADIFNLDVIHIPRFAAEGKIVPIELENDISLVAPVRRVCERTGTDQLWAVPFNSDVGMMFRRVTDKRADAPVTLKSVLAASATGPVTFAGQLDTVGRQTDEAFVCNVLEHALAQDEAILDEGGVLSYGLGQWRDALAPLADAIRRKRVVAAAGEDDTARAFQRDSLRYMRNWPVRYLPLDRAERARPDTAEIRIDRLPLGILGGQSLAVAADSDYRDEAVRAIHFLTDNPAQKLLTSFGFAPTSVDAYIDADLQEALPHLSLVRYAVEGSRPRPIHANYAEFARRFADHTRRHLHDGEELTQQFITDIRSVLR
ncbi:ABC transporter-binding protein [Paractinoplanes rhizophilus]|jgi:multiple sugar transport system substrate-binding protein|uniref:ABC transporter-binding protein n=1 Tax=Paractinoplanes rhizophilus TaxID=1416877 RepID=A0ABW2HZG6_9ACTN